MGTGSADAELLSAGDQICGNIRVVRRTDNHRLMEVHVTHSVTTPFSRLRSQDHFTFLDRVDSAAGL